MSGPILFGLAAAATFLGIRYAPRVASAARNAIRMATAQKTMHEQARGRAGKTDSDPGSGRSESAYQDWIRQQQQQQQQQQQGRPRGPSQSSFQQGQYQQTQQQQGQTGQVPPFTFRFTLPNGTVFTFSSDGAGPSFSSSNPIFNTIFEHIRRSGATASQQQQQQHQQQRYQQARQQQQDRFRDFYEQFHQQQQQQQQQQQHRQQSSYGGGSRAGSSSSNFMTRSDALQILGLRSHPPPTEKEIGAAYRKLMLVNHPDRGGSPEKTAKINEARSILLRGLGR
ncbi:hypothetical protein H696_01988 [Fonticula alba]|uniref:J domain-containing protein n=1 Tax=Fonticula alba TaxID=691883 RepID=A0A058Z9Y7_FONAL|nr:hypothetical protein H696_01988 [Fonticula alba]KCV71040.1 hypothetical protein H696_01988 [Fonticula alba]|eukprot:XP_009494163.1 hypothetical protein H696_01988 [Fonticula alba]